MKHIVRCSILLVIILLGSFISSAAILAKGSNDINELKKSFQAEDVKSILNTLNSIKELKYKVEALGFLADLWNQEQSKYPDLSWSTINKDIVRLNIVVILVTANSNGHIKIDVKPMRQYVLSLIQNKDLQLASEAIMYLSLFRDPKDVPLLLGMAKRNERSTFRYSVIALSTICVPSAMDALKELKSYFKEKKIIAYMDENIKKSQSLHKIGYCNNF